MDSPHILHLGFLLLALAAPRPNIAMSSDDPAKGTKDSSSGNTTVTVYHCKDCESSTCQAKAISFENFEKIAETQTMSFSNGVIEIVTTETHILVCFKQEKSFLEGIFGIVWEKSGGAGRSCGILNSEAIPKVKFCASLQCVNPTSARTQPDPENGRGNISTEENKICCEAETDVWKHNPALKCYPEMKPALTRNPPDDIPDNPENPASQMNSFGILFTVAFLAFLTGTSTMYCYFWHRRGQASRQDRQDPETEIALCQQDPPLF
ncbi:uncharacterized protein [Aphelocoma coerulescens]|uniref:uncharacterized protein isoform X1 n=1 Tax=Aphelocoma coerulescens TaxID=39617 RepID=UPI003604A199